MNALMANNTQDKVQQLQRKLYQSAKQNSKRKFHALYDKVHREDILRAAWERVRRNKGCGGIDGLQIADVEASGVEALLGELQRELKAGTYRPRPVKRTYIPKPDGSQRPLGIPVIKDRIVQMAAKLVLEHIFEADFKDFSYGFRPNRSAKQALEVVRKACNRKGWWAVDVDIKGYFDAINHEKLMLMVKTRVSDRRMQKLIPSKKAMQKMRDRIREVLGKRNVLWKEASSLVAELNPVLRGWRNYYGLKTAFLWLAKVDRYVRQMFTRWYNKKRKRKRHLAEMGKVCGLLTDLKLIKLAA